MRRSSLPIESRECKENQIRNRGKCLKKTHASNVLSSISMLYFKSARVLMQMTPQVTFPLREITRRTMQNRGGGRSRSISRRTIGVRRGEAGGEIAVVEIKLEIGGNGCSLRGRAVVFSLPFCPPAAPRPRPSRIPLDLYGVT